MRIPSALLSGLADDSEELLYDLLCFAAGLDQLEGKVKARYETQDCHDPVRDRTRNDCPCYAAKQHQPDGEYQSGSRASVPFLGARGYKSGINGLHISNIRVQRYQIICIQARSSIE